MEALEIAALAGFEPRDHALWNLGRIHGS